MQDKKITIAIAGSIVVVISIFCQVMHTGAFPWVQNLKLKMEKRTQKYLTEYVF